MIQYIRWMTISKMTLIFWTGQLDTCWHHVWVHGTQKDILNFLLGWVEMHICCLQNNWEESS